MYKKDGEGYAEKRLCGDGMAKTHPQNLQKKITVRAQTTFLYFTLGAKGMAPPQKSTPGLKSQVGRQNN